MLSFDVFYAVISPKLITGPEILPMLTDEATQLSDKVSDKTAPLCRLGLHEY